MLEGRTFQVIKGFGMGAIHSGEVSDAVYHVMAEKHWSANEAIMAQCKVYGYVRYRDDIFILHGKRFIFDGLILRRSAASNQQSLERSALMALAWKCTC